MDVVVELGWGKSPRMKNDRVNFAISRRYGGKDSSEGIVQSVRFDDKWCAQNPVSQDQCGGEGLL